VHIFDVDFFAFSGVAQAILAVANGALLVVVVLGALLGKKRTREADLHRDHQPGQRQYPQQSFMHLAHFLSSCIIIVLVIKPLAIMSEIPRPANG
jgi:hypothetical protein